MEGHHDLTLDTYVTGTLPTPATNSCGWLCILYYKVLAKCVGPNTVYPGPEYLILKCQIPVPILTTVPFPHTAANTTLTNYIQNVD